MKEQITINIPFSGLYESIWLNSDSIDEIEEDNYREQEGLPAIDWVRSSFRYKEYFKDVSEFLTKKWLDTLADELGIEIHFQKEGIERFSPTYYNYSTDSISYSCEIDSKDIERICTMLEADNGPIRKRIKESWSSCSGFISFLSNSLDEWVCEIRDRGEHWQDYISLALQYLYNGDISEWEINQYYEFPDSLMFYYDIVEQCEVVQ